MQKKNASRSIKHYGWIPDLPDHRDRLYIAPQVVLADLPPRIDLRAQCLPVYDQGALGSCTANAIGAAHQFDQLRQAKPDVFMPSRLFIYYNERVIEGTVQDDAGAMIRDGIKSIARQGVASEVLWPYVLSKFATRPPKRCFDAALANQALSYQRLTPVLSQLKACLASGFPFIFGFSVYESFESEAVARSGTVPMPDAQHESQLGGHAVLAVGYDEASQRFIVRNSWGAQWGDKGYCTFPYAYMLDTNLCDDFWTVRLVE
jgi:C1A family cysteine protease